MAAKQFVCYEGDSEKVVRVKEFQISVALMEGRQKLLSQEVPSQWGPVHLFDLCLTFGHVDTAMAMAEKGVRGCRLETYHFRKERRYPKVVQYHNPLDNLLLAACSSCKDEWRTCDQCCFGFPVEQGIWMEDWDARVHFVSKLAPDTAVLRATLEILQVTPTLPFSVSEEAMVHLLDLAILTGNKEAARHCAEMTKLRPLRRWSCKGFIVNQGRSYPPCSCRLDDDQSIQLLRHQYDFKDSVLLAALSAGADLQGLKGLYGLPLRQAVAMFSAKWEPWDHDFEKLLPAPESPWEPMGETDFGEVFIEIDTEVASVSKERLQTAQKVGISLNKFGVRAHSLSLLMAAELRFSLLDVAILTGQSDCAVLCATLGAKLSQDGCKILQQHPATAAAAAENFLALSWKSEISIKAVAVYQVMRWFSCGRPFQAKLVNQVIAFSMEVPEIVEKLNMWEEANAWCRSDWWKCLFQSQKPKHTEGDDAFATVAQLLQWQHRRPAQCPLKISRPWVRKRPMAWWWQWEKGEMSYNTTYPAAVATCDVSQRQPVS